MKENEFLDGVSNIDADVIERFVNMDNKLQSRSKRSRNIWIRALALAACVALVIGVIATVVLLQGGETGQNIPEEPSLNERIFLNVAVEGVDANNGFADSATAGVYTKKTDEYFEGAVCDGVRCGGVERFYKAEGWELYLSSGDPLVSVHIPSGGPLSPVVVSEDLKLGGEIIRAAFGDFKAYYCSSWLLDSEIKDIIGRETNITRFGDRFVRYPIKTNGGAVYSYVWHLPPTTPASELPDAGSFANALRAHIAAGGYVYGASGVFTEIV